MLTHEILRPYVSCILKEVGFHTVDYVVLELLTEMFQSLIVEISKSSKMFTEAAGRAEPLPADVTLALIDLGIQLNEIEQYAFRSNNKYTLPVPVQSVQTKQLAMLAAGCKQHLPYHIPNHLPQFPDPHAYTRTPTHKKPVTEYEAIREKAASQKRDLEKALNKFKSKTNETESLFFSIENDVFPLIAVKLEPRTYLTALLPKDQVYDEDDDTANNVCKKNKTEKELLCIEDDDEENNSKLEPETIDNPYLRSIKTCPKWNIARKII